MQVFDHVSKPVKLVIFFCLRPSSNVAFLSRRIQANELKQWFLLICIEFDATEMRRLNWALASWIIWEYSVKILEWVSLDMHVTIAEGVIEEQTALIYKKTS